MASFTASHNLIYYKFNPRQEYNLYSLILSLHRGMNGNNLGMGKMPMAKNQAQRYKE